MMKINFFNLKSTSILFLCFFYSIFLNSQETIKDLLYTDNKILKLDGFEKCDTEDINFIHCYNIGIEKYYYKNGKISSIIKVNKESNKLIDVFNIKGEQLVKNGNGFDFVIEVGYGDFQHRDSLVFEIRDSFRTGIFKRYRRNINTEYYLMITGFFNKGIEEGKWISNEYKLGIFSIENYINGKLNGYFTLRQNKKNIIETGYYINDLKNGLWTISDTNNLRIEETNYLNHYKKGNYIKYLNGKISIKGIYNQIKGIREKTLVNFETGEEINNKYQVDNLEVKNGIWEYFDEKGNIVKTEIYNNGVLIK